MSFHFLRVPKISFHFLNFLSLRGAYVAPSAPAWRHVSATRGASGATSAVTPAAFGAFPKEGVAPPSYKICQPVLSTNPTVLGIQGGSFAGWQIL